MKQDLDAVEARRRVPVSIRSCHTATVNGYTIEGHVPAAAIKHLLRTRPNIVGIGVPGMPAGSPGMESPMPVRYDIMAWRASGEVFRYATVDSSGSVTFK